MREGGEKEGEKEVDREGERGGGGGGREERHGNIEGDRNERGRE